MEKLTQNIKIGLVPMSAKPLHSGHFGLIELAANENDEVHLFVSLSDRDVISGKAMEKIWKTQIEAVLPANVQVSYVSIPVRSVYEEIGLADEKKSKNVYQIYSDVVDIEKNFSDNSLKKYAKNLFKLGKIKRRGVERTSTVDISGTKMREFLKSNDKKSFISYMPKKIDANKAWNTLRSAMNENLIKDYVKLSLMTS